MEISGTDPIICCLNGDDVVARSRPAATGSGHVSVSLDCLMYATEAPTRRWQFPKAALQAADTNFHVNVTVSCTKVKVIILILSTKFHRITY